MEEEKLTIIQKYFDYRKNNPDIRDEVIDNIFLKEMVWLEDKHIFPTYDRVKSFFEREDVFKGSCVGQEVKSGRRCGTMMRNAQIVDNIDECIYTRVYEELEKRDFKTGKNNV
ncbi:hypothetical protein LCGC14_2114920 [marine sediment metagenome]|uniref:Uncharacterized protein n=1 Tax=marine sediment metagenome TaxID=412755 RepID=A0A0F9H2A6_9ZZZZ